MVEWVEIGPCRLACGDCLEVLPTLARVDAVVTDPPYGLNGHNMRRAASMMSVAWDSSPVSEETIKSVLSVGKVHVIWGGNYYRLSPSRCFLIWDKRNEGRDFADVEMAWTNLDAVARIFRMRPMNMDGGKVHPYQKPEALIEWCVNFTSGDMVLDPFMGSGTTGVACIRTGRKFIGIEIEPRYFDIACRRIERAWQEKKSELPFDKPPAEVQPDLF